MIIGDHQNIGFRYTWFLFYLIYFLLKIVVSYVENHLEVVQSECLIT